jgi:hypothetical protein
MISARLRQSTITLYVATGMDAQRRPTYSREVLAGVFLEKEYQSVMERRGIAVKDKAQVVIDLNATPPSTLNFPANSFFVEGVVTDLPPTKTKQQIGAERTVWTITRALVPPCGRTSAVTLEIYGA